MCDRVTTTGPFAGQLLRLCNRARVVRSPTGGRWGWEMGVGGCGAASMKRGATILGRWRTTRSTGVRPTQGSREGQGNWSLGNPREVQTGVSLQ